jgi:hypothetical protein
MSNFTFLTSNNQEFETTYFAIDSDKIETLNVSDCYDNNGQQVGAYNASDYISLTSEDAEILNKWCNTNAEKLDDEEGTKYCFVQGDIIMGDDFRFDIFTGTISKDSIMRTTCKGFTFWNGNNHKTITVSVEHGEPTHSIVTDEKLIEKLNNAIENKGEGASSFGQISYLFEDVSIVNSAYATSFATYEITFN